MDIDFSRGGLQLRLANAAYASSNPNLQRFIVSSPDLPAVFYKLLEHPDLDSILFSFFKDFPERADIFLAIRNIPNTFYKSLFLKYLFEVMEEEKSMGFSASLVHTFSNQDAYSALNACVSMPKEIQKNVMILLYDTANILDNPGISIAVGGAVTAYAKSPFLGRMVDAMDNAVSEDNPGDLLNMIELLDAFQSSPHLEKMLDCIELKDDSDETFIGRYESLKNLLSDGRLQPTIFDLVARIHKLCLSCSDTEDASSVLHTLSKAFEGTEYSPAVLKDLLDISRYRKGEEGYQLVKNAIDLLADIKDPILGERATRDLQRVRRDYDNQRVYCDIVREVATKDRAVAILDKAAYILSKVDEVTAIDVGTVVSIYHGHPNLEARISKLKERLIKKGSLAVSLRAIDYQFLHEFAIGRALGY